MEWIQEQENNFGGNSGGSGGQPPSNQNDQQQRSYPGQNGNSYDKPSYTSAPRPEGGGNQGGGYNNGQQGGQPRQQWQGNNGQQRQWQGNNGNRGGFGGGQGGGGGGFKRREPDPNPQLYLPYAVGGNKNPPQHIIEVMHRCAKKLESMGYTMRCGGMAGTEDVFEKATNRNEIHLPWRDFDKKDSKLTFTPPEAKILASKFQPGYDGLPNPVQTFLAKNVRVLFGNNLKSPALFVIAWSEDGAETARERTPKTGDVGHMVAIATAMRIPVFNLGKQDGEHRLMEYLASSEQQAQDNSQSQQQY